MTQEHPDRAEIRRRNRLAAKERREAEALGIAVAAPAAAAPQPAAAAPLGFRAALRGSFGLAPIRGDVAALPGILRTRAFAVPLAVTLLVAIVALQSGALASQWVQLAVQSVLLPPAFVLAFIAGMLTKRGAWLMGALFGLLSYGAAIFVANAADLSAMEATNPVRTMLEGIATRAAGGGAAIFSDLYFVAVAGMFAGAFAGWYNRFLRAMSPSRAARERRGQRRRG